MEPFHPTDDINTLSLHEVTKKYGEDGLRERLVNFVLDQEEWSDNDKRNVLAAEALALEAHSGDTRGELPYSTHFMRVALRISSPKHIGVNDPSLMVAALLHDTVEDHADFYSTNDASLDRAHTESQAIRFIGLAFGTDVKDIVYNVTNPPYPAGVSSREEKNAFYREHVVEVLETNERAGTIKLSDFIDNCVGLIHNEDPARAARLAIKYQPLIPHFKDFVANSTLIPDDNKTYLNAQLDAAYLRCEMLKG